MRDRNDARAAGALVREIPTNERLVAIEDSAELNLVQANAVGLIASRGRLGESAASTDELLQASLRLRPDRILLGEIRGEEALTFLRAINTGHPGSMTTIHADSAERALSQMAMLALQSGAHIGQSELRELIASLVDIVIQLERVGGMRQVADIYWNKKSQFPAALSMVAA
jgi:type IV secretion system protein VirB11